MVKRDEKVAKAKKPFFKKWWFWLIVVIIIAIAVGGGSKSEPKKISDSKTNTKTEAKSESKTEPEKTTFKVEETVELDGVHFVVNSVNYNAGSTYSKPNDGNQYVLVNVTIENKGKETISYNPFDFKLDDNGNQTDLSEYVSDDDGNQIANDTLNSGNLAENGKVTGTMVGQAKVGDKYKLMYTGNMFNEKEKIAFELN